MIHTIYVDRTEGQLYGAITLQRLEAGKAIKIFERLPVSSGQFPYLDGGPDDWVRDKGATPFGDHWMGTKKEALLSAEPKGTPFYPIGTEKGSRIIKGPRGQTREDIGLHLDGGPPGTAGCTALLYDTPERECLVWAFFAYLDRLNRYEPYVKFVVL